MHKINFNNIKELKKHKCILCGMPTYSPKGICVLCETGINKLYSELKELCERGVNKNRKNQKAVKAVTG